MIKTALQYVGIIEQGKNRGKEIEEWQRNVNIPIGSPYCAAFVSYILDDCKVSLPTIRSGVATKFITKNSIKATDVYKGRIKINGDYLVIWKHGDTWRGHIGIKLKWNGRNGYVIEANTKYRGNEGVFIMYRQIKPYSYFRIVNFTRVKCGKQYYQRYWVL